MLALRPHFLIRSLIVYTVPIDWNKSFIVVGAFLKAEGTPCEWWSGIFSFSFTSFTKILPFLSDQNTNHSSVFIGIVFSPSLLPKIVPIGILGPETQDGTPAHAKAKCGPFTIIPNGELVEKLVPELVKITDIHWF